jgi:hypothetical protein
MLLYVVTSISDSAPSLILRWQFATVHQLLSLLSLYLHHIPIPLDVKRTDIMSSFLSSTTNYSAYALPAAWFTALVPHVLAT